MGRHYFSNDCTELSWAVLSWAKFPVLEVFFIEFILVITYDFWLVTSSFACQMFLVEKICRWYSNLLSSFHFIFNYLESCSRHALTRDFWDLYSEVIPRKLETQIEFIIGGCNLKNIRCLMMMAYSEWKLQELIETAIIEMEKNDEPAINSKRT